VKRVKNIRVQVRGFLGVTAQFGNPAVRECSGLWQYLWSVVFWLLLVSQLSGVAALSSQKYYRDSAGVVVNGTYVGMEVDMENEYMRYTQCGKWAQPSTGALDPVIGKGHQKRPKSKFLIEMESAPLWKKVSVFLVGSFFLLLRFLSFAVASFLGFVFGIGYLLSKLALRLIQSTLVQIICWTADHIAGVAYQLSRYQFWLRVIRGSLRFLFWELYFLFWHTIILLFGWLTVEGVLLRPGMRPGWQRLYMWLIFSGTTRRTWWIVIQLSGSHGEWTNGDDFDEAARVRNIKAAHTNRHRREPGKYKGKKGGEVKYCKHLKPDCPYENCKFPHREPAVVAPGPGAEEDQARVPEVEMESVVASRGIAFDGSTFFLLHALCVVMTEVWFDVAERELIPFVGHQYQMITTHVLPRFTALGIQFCGGPLDCVNPLYDILRSEFSLLSSSLRNFDALYRYVHKKFAVLPDELIRGTILVYLYNMSQLHPDASSTYVDVSAFSRIGVGSYIPGPFRIPSAACAVLDNYCFNLRWKLVKREGFTFRYHPTGDVVEYPIFTTKVNARERFHVDAFFRFDAPSPFTYYEIDGHNACKALSRLFKARGGNENECKLFLSQLRLLHTLPSLSFLDECSAEVEVSWGGKILTSRLGREYHLPAVTTSEMMAYGLCLSFLRERLESVPFFEAILDMLKLFVYYVGKTLCYVEVGFLWIYLPVYQFVDRLEWLQSVVHCLPSPKRHLYIMWFESEREWNVISGGYFEWETKVKKEAGKVGKVPRVYGSGGSACLVDKISPEICKKAFKEWIPISEFFNSTSLVMLKFCEAQAPKDSDDMYREAQGLLRDGTYFYIFSDDMFVVRKEGFRVELAECDISSCDSSNGPFVFGFAYYLLRAVGGHDLATALIRQCTNNCRLRNPSEDTEFVLLQPETFFEYSGSVLTTLLNNIASLMIAMGYCQQLIDNPTTYLADLVAGASRNGWVITASTKSSWHGVTFLKRSYTGSHSFLCLGTIFRSLGVVEEGISCQTLGLSYKAFSCLTDEQKFEKYLFIRVQGYTCENISPVINALFERVGLPKLPEVVSLEDYKLRYGGEDWEWNVLLTEIASLKLGNIIYCNVLNRIYKIDYDLDNKFDVH
jgi:hypothetical protein